MASVSWISPPAPGAVRSKMPKISGGSTQRPRMEYSDRMSSFRWGFSTMSVHRKQLPSRGSTFREEYFLMASSLTSLTPTTPFPYRSQARMSWPHAGSSPRITSSP